MSSLGASPQGKDLVERPGEVVSRVGIDSLEETKGDPNILQ